jgi:hypothetical protein
MLVGYNPRYRGADGPQDVVDDVSAVPSSLTQTVEQMLEVLRAPVR